LLLVVVVVAVVFVFVVVDREGDPSERGDGGALDARYALFSFFEGGLKKVKKVSFFILIRPFSLLACRLCRSSFGSVQKSIFFSK